jgi:hypothetical protein
MSLDFALLRNDEPEVQLPPTMVAQSGFSRHCVAQSSKFTPDFPLSPGAPWLAFLSIQPARQH